MSYMLPDPSGSVIALRNGFSSKVFKNKTQNIKIYHSLIAEVGSICWSQMLDLCLTVSLFLASYDIYEHEISWFVV